jgi:hypothetical protein
VTLVAEKDVLLTYFFNTHRPLHSSALSKAR